MNFPRNFLLKSPIKLMAMTAVTTNKKLLRNVSSFFLCNIKRLEFLLEGIFLYFFFLLQWYTVLKAQNFICFCITITTDFESFNLVNLLYHYSPYIHYRYDNALIYQSSFIPSIFGNNFSYFCLECENSFAKLLWVRKVSQLYLGYINYNFTQGCTPVNYLI